MNTPTEIDSRDRTDQLASDPEAPRSTELYSGQLSFLGRVEHEAPLALEQVQALYERIDWSFVDRWIDPQRKDYVYQFRVAMCKALVLPYLMSVRSLTELALKFTENDAYRVICGFYALPPKMGQLRYVKYAYLSETSKTRAKNQADATENIRHHDLTLEILVRIAIVGDRLGLALPFRHAYNASLFPQAGDELVQWTLELPEYPDTEADLTRQAGEPFPVQVHRLSSNRLVDAYCIREPAWMDKDAPIEPHVDRSSRSRSGHQYTACSALVLSPDGSKVLLGKRKASYMPGFYALPGGRWHPGESLRRCVERELEEETGIRVVNLQPISISFNRYEREHQECWSIGAQITEHTGQLTLREPDKCESWDWWDLNALPQPLFRPSQIVIDDFKLKRFPDLGWESIEDWIVNTQQDEIESVPIEQLRLAL